MYTVHSKIDYVDTLLPMLNFALWTSLKILSESHQLDNSRDVMIQDIDFSPNGSTIDQPFCTRNVKNVSGDPNLKFMNFRRPSPFNWNSCDVLGVSGNDELLYSNRDCSRNVWNGWCLSEQFDLLLSSYSSVER